MLWCLLAPARGIAIKETNAVFFSWSSLMLQMSGAAVSCSLVDGLCCTVTALAPVELLSSGMQGLV